MNITLTAAERQAERLTQIAMHLADPAMHECACAAVETLWPHEVDMIEQARATMAALFLKLALWHATGAKP